MTLLQTKFYLSTLLIYHIYFSYSFIKLLTVSAYPKYIDAKKGEKRTFFLKSIIISKTKRFG